MSKPALDLQGLTDDQAILLATTVAARMGENAAQFPTPKPPLASLTATAAELQTAMNDRAALQSQVTQKTLQIRSLRTTLDEALATEAGYVDETAGGDPEIIRAAGMRPSADPAPVGDMPKVTGLTATAGDADGEVDLSWDPVRRGLKSYNIEKTEDPAGQTGWTYAASSSKSRAALEGLPTGKRLWFRVSALGSAGPGPWSDPATKVVP